MAALSGLMFCIDCGEKMRLGWNNTTNGSKKKPRKYVCHNFNCGRYRLAELEKLIQSIYEDIPPLHYYYI